MWNGEDCKVGGGDDDGGVSECGGRDECDGECGEGGYGEDDDDLEMMKVEKLAMCCGRELAKMVSGEGGG